MKSLKNLAVTSMMMFSFCGATAVKAQECTAILDESIRSIKQRAVSNPQLPEKNDETTIDVLVVYTPSAKDWATQNGYDIDQLIDVAMQRSNLSLANSQAGVTLRLAHRQQIDYVEDANPNNDLARLRDPQDGRADEAHALRTQYNADLVVLLLGEATTSNVLGAGYIPNSEWGNAKSGFSVTRVKTLPSGFTFIHELGHNLGCGHHTDVDKTALYNYAHGHRGVTNQSNRFSTIMTYETTTGTYYPHIPYFSDPNVMLEGVAVGTETANNAKTIRQFKSVVAGYSDEAKWIDAFLKAVNLSKGTLTPAFNPGIYNYTVDVDNTVSSVDIEGIVNSPYASVISGNQTAMPLAVGDNKAEIVVEDGWGNYNKTYTFTIRRSSVSTDVAEPEAGEIKIFPNPVVDELRMESGQGGINQAEIYNIAGNAVMTQRFAGENSLTFNVSSLPQGIYLLKIETTNGFVTKKFTKK